MRSPDSKTAPLLLGIVRVTITLLVSFPGSVGQEVQKAKSNLRSLPAITSRAEFDSLARVYSDKSYPLPHVLFVIDRKDKNKIYYVNSTRYPFHKDFVNGTYLSLERQELFENHYLKPTCVSCGHSPINSLQR